jgi:hypothetical protein
MTETIPVPRSLLTAPPAIGAVCYRPNGYFPDGQTRPWVQVCIVETFQTMARFHDTDCLPVPGGSVCPWRILSSTPYP